MALHLLYGSALSGKTEELYDRLIGASLREPGRQFIMLVPEQASITVQEELVRRHPRHALFNIDVLTFNRLAIRVFEALHEKERDILDDAGKLMLVTLVTERAGDRLGVLRRNVGRNGFSEEVKSVMSELAEYNISPETLRKKAETLADHPSLSAKLRDISLLYREFMSLLHERYEMVEERTVRLAKRISDWPEIRNTCFYLDGFTGFTPPQYEALEALIRISPEVSVGAVIGSGRRLQDQRREEDLFYMSAHMAAYLKEISIKNGIPYTEETVPEREDLGVSPEIRHLERYLFESGKAAFGGKNTHISLCRAKDIAAEVRMVLQEVHKAVREGLSYRDMAVISGDPALYRAEIEEQFGAADIPFFLDARKKLSEDPLFLLTEQALRVCANRWSYDFFSDFSKNPLVSAYIRSKLPEDGDCLSPYERICETENYALALGIRGKSAWCREFTKRYAHFTENRLEPVNEIRALLSAPLAELDTKLHGKNVKTSARIEALRAFLTALGTEETLAQLSEQAGDPLLKREYENSSRYLDTLLDRMNEILGEECLSLEVFTEVLASGLREAKLGLVPPTRDRLVIGDLRRTRLGAVRKLFVIGANEGLLPPGESEGGLLSDSDRMLLQEADVQLAPTARSGSFNMQFYLYLLLTRPSESLRVSYFTRADDGKTAVPGILPGLLRALFPDLRAKAGESLPGSLSDGLPFLAEILREEGQLPESLRKLADIYRAHPEFSGHFRKMEEGQSYSYTADRLAKSTAYRLFGETVSGSVTRLERYARCPYAHFLTYGLRLREREDFRLDSADYGSLFHESINRFFAKMRTENEDWHEISESRRTELVRESVAEVTSEYGNAILSDNARNSYLVSRVNRLTDRTLWALKKQWDEGGFTKTESEVPFSKGNRIPALTLPLHEGLQLALEGRIDRIDYCEDPDKIYVRVIDYKSGSTELDPTKVYYGLQLQLLIYLRAAEALLERKNPGKTAVPAGIYYYHIDDPIVDEETGKDPETEILSKLRMSGLTMNEEEILKLTDAKLSGIGARSTAVKNLYIKKDGTLSAGAAAVSRTAFSALEDYAAGKAQELANDMLRGNISVSPCEYGQENSCTYCGFRGICGFDPRIPGYRKKRLLKKTFSDITGEGEDNEVDG